MYDFLIVGAGFFGATLARRLTSAGRSCLVIDRRPHVAGNCYTELRAGTLVHVYGPHYFHTNSDRVWNWVKSFGMWKSYVPRVKASVNGRIFSFPINLLTLSQLWGVCDPTQAAQRLASQCANVTGTDAESYLLRTVGVELYETFFYGYTTKQWGRPPCELPSSIVSRVPMRLTFDDSYHIAEHQALPVGGYTPVIEALLDGSRVELGTDFKDLRKKIAKQVVFTGSVDELYSGPRLPYRSLRFEHTVLPIADFQGCAQMNYPDAAVAFTRIVEHKHLHGGLLSETSITHEFPADEGEPYYPIPTDENTALAHKYRAQAEADGYLIGGRLGTYKYMDMDGAIASALIMADRILG